MYSTIKNKYTSTIFLTNFLQYSATLKFGLLNIYWENYVLCVIPNNSSCLIQIIIFDRLTIIQLSTRFIRIIRVIFFLKKNRFLKWRYFATYDMHCSKITRKMAVTNNIHFQEMKDLLLTANDQMLLYIITCFIRIVWAIFF